MLQYVRLLSVGTCSIDSMVSSTDDIEDLEMESWNKSIGVMDGSSMSVGLGE
jgi:hypothetical protein